MSPFDQLNFTNSFARLPEAFYSRVVPTPLERPKLASFNAAAAALIDLNEEAATHPGLITHLNGEVPINGSEPLAMLYSGHQFGGYVEQLGDGRAILLGEVTNSDGQAWELQLKGAGLTPYSRDGDGRAVLRSTIREYLCSEAMHGLGIPTTRALCMLGSSEEVYRERIESGALLLRMAPSHIRFGSFEVFYYRGQFDRLRTLADYLIRNHYPELEQRPEPYAALLEQIIGDTARLIAQWQLVGFAHGVMNTDNMSALGLTLDYGPFGFLDAYDPGYICNHSDHWGRYAFDRQPQIALWNLSCLAQAMLPLLNPDDPKAAAEQARSLLNQYDPAFNRHYGRGMAAKLGLQEAREGDATLTADLLKLMHEQQVDYTLLFRALSHIHTADTESEAAARDLFVDRTAFDRWADAYRSRLQAEGSSNRDRQERMQQVNPKYILRNYLAQQAIVQAEAGDFSELERLFKLLQNPYDEQPDWQQYAAEPPAWAESISVSCSS